MKKFKLFICLIGFLLLIGSCISSKRARSFSQLNESGLIEIKFEQAAYTFIKGDIVKVNLSNADLTTMAIFENFNTSGGGLVNDSGFIQLPILGRMLIGGKSEFEVKEEIEKIFKANGIASNAVVNVSVSNKGISILGEVNKPGRISFQGNGLTLTEAIAQAGDFTGYAKRNNILLIRQSDKGLKYRRFNINDSSAFSNEVYFLKQNDVIYVEPNASKVFVTSQIRSILGFVSGVISLVIIVTTLR